MTEFGRGLSVPPAARLPRDERKVTGESPLKDLSDAEPPARSFLRFARRHGLFGVLLMAGTLVRTLAMLGFRGFLWTPDSTRYVRNAVHLAPGTVRPSGYSLMLWLLSPLHSLTAVIGVQHLLGLGIAAIGYGLLRRIGLPGWGATLAMAPALLSAYTIQLEHFAMSDTLFTALVVIAIALALWWPVTPLWAYGPIGLVLGAAAVTRTEGAALLVAFLAFLLARAATGRTFGHQAADARPTAGTRTPGFRTALGMLALSAAFAIPVTSYAAWYDSVHGKAELTSATGAFFYGAAATFAECATIQPPAAERRLCLRTPVNRRMWADYYIWSGPITSLPGGPFGQRADSLGMSFAERAVEAQPLDYLTSVGANLGTDFLPPPSTNSPDPATRNRAMHLSEFMFPAGPPRKASLSYARVFSAYDPAGAHLRMVQPYAGWIRAYQRFVIVPGPLLAIITLIGLGGVIAAWRRFGGAALLPCLAGLCLLLAPAAIAESYPRYLVGDITPLCLAAAMGIWQATSTTRASSAPVRRGPHARGEFGGQVPDRVPASLPVRRVQQPPDER